MNGNNHLGGGWRDILGICLPHRRDLSPHSGYGGGPLAFVIKISAALIIELYGKSVGSTPGLRRCVLVASPESTPTTLLRRTAFVALQFVWPKFFPEDLPIFSGSSWQQRKSSVWRCSTGSAIVFHDVAGLPCSNHVQRSFRWDPFHAGYCIPEQDEILGLEKQDHLSAQLRALRRIEYDTAPQEFLPQDESPLDLTERLQYTTCTALALILANRQPELPIAVLALDGTHILAAESHESEDIDNDWPLTYVLARSGMVLEDDRALALALFDAAADATQVSDIWTFITMNAPGCLERIFHELSLLRFSQITVALGTYWTTVLPKLGVRGAECEINGKEGPWMWEELCHSQGTDDVYQVYFGLVRCFHEAQAINLPAQYHETCIGRSKSDLNPKIPRKTQYCMLLARFASCMRHTNFLSDTVFQELETAGVDTRHVRRFAYLIGRLADFDAALEDMVAYRDQLFRRVWGTELRVQHIWASDDLSAMDICTQRVVTAFPPVRADINFLMYRLNLSWHDSPVTVANLHPEVQLVLWYQVTHEVESWLVRDWIYAAYEGRPNLPYGFPLEYDEARTISMGLSSSGETEQAPMADSKVIQRELCGLAPAYDFDFRFS
ncbi:hypothetical protein PUNSTDRAFT_44692 [Punctularia strigosozonata HHB-11173 SS5]|uniref:uncharacterized protein n=1 Tax=Punctularia strigosozonata (strain HHB-11173) TaxID=741275 RepID=UPI00044164CC|nr:uncharacterized protein PUNSTDRAFT_44692 [Punctularia strigosozonata HHB-11173 SS5]EIN09322.1 hypothetical protein PUNSTDRAFT_44692 [Punctularia strigosozonata HHB-11173 SS5]